MNLQRISKRLFHVSGDELTPNIFHVKLPQYNHEMKGLTELNEKQYNVARGSWLVARVYSLLSNSHVEHKDNNDSFCIDKKRSDKFMSGRFFVPAFNGGLSL